MSYDGCAACAVNIDQTRFDEISQAGDSVREWMRISASQSLPVAKPSDARLSVAVVAEQPCWHNHGTPFNTLVQDNGDTYQLADFPSECRPPPDLHLLWHNWVRCADDHSLSNARDDSPTPYRRVSSVAFLLYSSLTVTMHM